MSDRRINQLEKIIESIIRQALEDILKEELAEARDLLKELRNQDITRKSVAQIPGKVCKLPMINSQVRRV